MSPLHYSEETYKIRGAILEVYKTLGVGFLESVYHEALSIELANHEVPFTIKPGYGIRYKASLLERTFHPDFVCYSKIILEIKAISELTDANRAQVHNYLKASGFKLGLIVNFNHYPGVKIERIVK